MKLESPWAELLDHRPVRRIVVACLKSDDVGDGIRALVIAELASPTPEEGWRWIGALGAAAAGEPVVARVGARGLMRAVVEALRRADPELYEASGAASAPLVLAALAREEVN